MAEVGIERLAAGDDEEDEAERHQPDIAVIKQKRQGVDRVDGGDHPRIVANVQQPCRRDRDEPDHHDRGEEARHPRGAAALGGEQRDQDHDGERHDVVVEGGRDQLQSFHRREHGNRRRDDGVSQKHGSADDAEQEHERGAPPERARRQRGERQRAALAVIVRPQQQDDVFQGDHDN